MRIAATLALSAVVAASHIPLAQADELTIAAGAGYRRPVTEAIAAYEAQSGAKVGQVYGNLGQVFAQARESGRIGMVCGDRAMLEKAEGLAFTRFVPLGQGRLVVGYRQGLSLGAPEEIARDDIKRVAIPDEKNAVYGVAGRQYLDKSGLSAKVDAKLLAVATVPQVTAYLVSGEVDAGLLNASDAMGAQDKIGGYLPVDPALYEPIRIDCGVLDERAAQGLAEFLDTDAVRDIAKKYGM
ncbi:molybdate ABC transporter substrate-binding protein [Verticiella sediminum]|uniref:Molybdate ABC transporter substrate-binding protein n=1 Tax=Verticiella sediminum TaxID=1247510 RepID=A0A556AJD5_9BURK|nr:molybdate ABC transporter substrate-binding protein [Verticiella sediminum]TSH92986.1 molybdate ABC transporter substrate-binding protein [Verticiella sediminum]